MKKTKKVKAVKKENKKIKLSLDLRDIVFKSEADTFQEALEKIQKDSFGKIRTWGVLKLETEGKSSEFRYSPIQMKRAFVGSFAKDLLYKRLIMLLK